MATGLKEVRNTKIAKMKARGMGPTKIHEELQKTGEQLSVEGVKKVLTRPEVRELIEKEKSRLTALVPEAVTNYDHWVKNARMFHLKEDKEIAFKATTKVLESHGLVSGAPSEQVKITIQQSEVILSPVIESMLAGFMGKLREAKPIEPSTIDVEYEVVNEPENTQEDVREDRGEVA